MYFALSPGNIGIRTDLAGGCDIACKTGFKGITTDPDELMRMGTGRAADLLEEKGLRNAGFGVDPRIIDKQGGEWEDELRILEKRAKAERACGATRCSTWILSSCDVPKEDRIGKFVTHVRKISRVLGDEGIGFGLEFIGPLEIYTRQRYPFVRTMQEMLDVCAEVGERNCGLLLDSYHLYTSGGTMDDVLALRQDQVIVVHINDAVSGVAVDELKDQERLLPGETNVIDAARFLRNLARIGYEGPVITEPFYKPFREMTDDVEKARMTIAAMKRAYPGC